MKVQRLGVATLGFLLMLLVGATSASAQGPGTVMGIVTLDGKPVKDAVVMLKAADSDRTADSKTDKNGEYYIRVISGTYDAIVLINGKEVAKKPGIKVSGGLYGDPSSGNAFRNKHDFPMQTAANNPEAQKQQAEFEKKRSAYEHAAALNQAGKFEEALAELIPLAEKDSDQWVVHAQLGVAYQGLKRYPEAETSLKKAIELDPQNGVLYTTLGQVYVKMGNMEEGRKYFETAAQLSPEDAATAYFNIGVTLYNGNDLKSAGEWFKKATEADPARSEAYYLLGMCLYSQAQYKQEGQELKTIPAPGTQEAFQRYLELAPTGKYAEEAKAALQALGASVPASVRVRKK